MGVYDREYYREERQGFSLGGASAVTQIIILNVVLYFADALLFPSHWLMNFMSLDAQSWRRPWELYQLLTAGFAHAPDYFPHLLFNMFGLWVFGSELEQIYGRQEFWRLYLASIVFASLGWLIATNVIDPGSQSSMLGASGGVMALMMIYVHHFPKRLLYIWGVLPVPAWALAGVYVLLDIAGATSLRYGGNTAYAAHLSGALFGALYYRLHWNLGRVWPKQLGDVRKWFSSRPRVRLHDPETFDRELGDEVDRILDKISTEGEASLTKAERRTLETASRRYQQRRR